MDNAIFSLLSVAHAIAGAQTKVGRDESPAPPHFNHYVHFWCLDCQSLSYR